MRRRLAVLLGLGLGLGLTVWLGAAQQVPHPAPMSLPADNIALKALTGAVNLRAARLGFRVPGDGGYAEYNWVTYACDRPDDGYEVQPNTGTGCWIADFAGRKPAPEVWGAYGDGSRDDTAAITKAFAHIGIRGGKLYGLDGSDYAVSATINIPPDSCFVGAGSDRSSIVLLNGGVSPVIFLDSRACLEDVKIDATPQTGPGVVIQVGTDGDSHRARLDRVYTSKGCIAVDVNGSSHAIDRSYFYEMAAVGGCGGIRVGHNTQGGGTVELRVSETIVGCGVYPQVPDWGMLFEDSGGAYIGPSVDNIGCQYGTIIRPNTTQEVAFSFFNGMVLGDTNQQNGLLIDTSGTGSVRGNAFNQTWTAASIGKAGVKIRNTGSGQITGTVFTGHRAYLNFANGVEIDAPAGAGTITETYFNGLRVCGTQSGTDLVIGNNLAVTLQNSRLGKQCDGNVAGSTTGLSYGIGLGANVTLFATGNDLTYTGPEFWAPVSGIPAGNSVTAGNKGVDTNSGATYASAATVTLLFAEKYIHLTGTATVNTITPAWSGQELCVISDTGAVSFGTSGNIRATNFLSGQYAMVCGHYDGTYAKWYLH